MAGLHLFSGLLQDVPMQCGYGVSRNHETQGSHKFVIDCMDSNRNNLCLAIPHLDSIPWILPARAAGWSFEWNRNAMADRSHILFPIPQTPKIRSKVQEKTDMVHFVLGVGKLFSAAIYVCFQCYTSASTKRLSLGRSLHLLFYFGIYLHSCGCIQFWDFISFFVVVHIFWHGFLLFRSSLFLVLS